MDKDIGKIQKNPDTDIIVRVDDYMGKKGLTIREFVRSERYTGFTKAGTRIPADQFKAFKAMINAVDEQELSTPSQTQPASSQTTQQKFSNSSSKPAPKPKAEEFEDVEF